jgi:hypothetical protein
MTDEQRWLPTATAADRAAARDCLRCGAVTVDEGVWTIRTGGHSGGINFLFGSLAELGEDTMDVRMTVCPACGHVEFRRPMGD